MTASFKVKVLLTGSAASEKSELINKFIKSKFTSNYKLTMGVDILTKEVEYNPGEVAKVTIWDIGGDENFEFVRSTFYRGASGALIVFDLTREQTYEETRNWLTEIKQSIGEDIPYLLIGNKADLLEEVESGINREEVRALVEAEGMLYIETSTKTGELIEEAFTELTRTIIAQKKKEQSPEKETEEIPLEKKEKPSPRKIRENKKKELNF